MATKSSDVKASNFFSELQSSTDYRDFLKKYLQGKSLNLSDLARATGFARGFPSDVISGKRRLTTKSAYAFEKALKLPKPGKKFFRLLVAREELDLFPEIDRASIEIEVLNLKSKSWIQVRQNAKEIIHTDLKALLADSRAMGVYAAAGEPRSGASRNEIETRTSLYGRELERNLENLEKVGLLKRQDEQYYPRDIHLFLETHDQSELLSTIFHKACRAASDRIDKADSNMEMFFVSNFCVKKESLPELKRALRETVLKFVDDSINPSGDRVVKLITALHL